MFELKYVYHHNSSLNKSMQFHFAFFPCHYYNEYYISIADIVYNPNHQRYYKNYC